MGNGRLTRLTYHTAYHAKKKGGIAVKKRVFAALCALVLCFGLISAPGPAHAANDPCFMAVNDNLLLLQDQFIPIQSNGQYYMPYTVLDGNATGLQLGIYPIHNTLRNTLLIYSRDEVISFDLSTGVCTDRNGTVLSARAVTRNGRVYVPVRFICERFGLTYFNRNTTYGPLVRIRNSAYVLDDNTFVSLAQLMMEDRLQAYKAQGGGSAQQPSTNPGMGGVDTDRSGVRTYLAFRADQIGGLDSVLQQLRQYQAKALFFFPADDLAQYDEAVRRVLCHGHGVGLLVSGTTQEQAVQQAARGNRLLARIAHINTPIVWAPQRTDMGGAEQEKDTGLLWWDGNVDGATGEKNTNQFANTILADVQRYRYEVRIEFTTTENGAAVLSRVLPQLVRDRYNLRLAVETEL